MQAFTVSPSALRRVAKAERTTMNDAYGDHLPVELTLDD